MEQVTATVGAGSRWVDPGARVVVGAFAGAGDVAGAGDTQGLECLVGRCFRGARTSGTRRSFAPDPGGGDDMKVIGLGAGGMSGEHAAPVAYGGESAAGADASGVREQDVGIESIEMRSSPPGRTDRRTAVRSSSRSRMPDRPGGLDYQRLLTLGTLILDSSWLNEFLRNGGPLMRRFMSPQDAGVEKRA